MQIIQHNQNNNGGLFVASCLFLTVDRCICFDSLLKQHLRATLTP